MRLSEWAKREGVAYITAWRWWNEGKLPVPARKVGKLILVDVPEPGQGRTVVYARVSSADQKPDLDGQIARGWTVALEPAPEQAGKFHRDCGARRFACNWRVRTSDP